MPTTQKIRYADCDVQAVVFNANYARYWDDAITDWIEELGFGGQALHQHGADMATVRVEIDFRAPARLGDVLVTTAALERIGNTSIAVALETRRSSDGQLIVEGREVFVFFNPEDRRPVPVPAAVKAALEAESGTDKPG